VPEVIKIICVCGARPNFMKMAPLMRAFKTHGGFEIQLVHTGQHYDEEMSSLFFKELQIPEPDINLEVGSGSHTMQTSEIMKRFEPVVLDFKPDYVLVVGDVNSTIACGLVAVKLGIKLIHVEAGLRSFDRTMPEEINRILTDAISDLLFVSEQSGLDNLRREGIPEDKIHFVGNVMIDTLLANRERAAQSKILDELNLRPWQYGVITLHRPSNVDDIKQFEQIICAFEQIQKELVLVFPMHPRTRKNLCKTKLGRRMKFLESFRITAPLGYLDFLKLMSESCLVMTDSGGIQEETTILEIPCITLRENTERPVTITDGTNHLVNLTTQAIVDGFREIRSKRDILKDRRPPLWDGKAAERIIELIVKDWVVK
jgi:UDP-N-acetylglucosamine 2-epimerase (non-hydrolysing)